ncbi:IclR family transcriptional regulator [Caballeronia sp. LZ033]|nr:IclR family transcriptional regulator [Caballeronia sp. LZ033]MDR5815364.1 IclR family transcriptional regulator [Caballeronia sp. LZ033]
MAKRNTTDAARRGARQREGEVRATADEIVASDRAGSDEPMEERGEEEAGASAYLVPGLERGLRILTEFSAREPVLGAPELSRRIGIPRTTTFRLLQTLESLGFLERVNGDRQFQLGVAVLRLGFEYLSSLELTDLGTPVLERLRDTTGLSAHLLIRDGRDVVFVAKAQTREPMFSSVKVNVGTRLPGHATVHGQVLMGDLTLAELRALYPEKQFERYTDRTPATLADLYARVRESAEHGFALSEASFETGISVVSAPVRDQSGRIVAAITVTVPRSNIGGEAERAPLVSAVCGAALDLSTRLNYRPGPNDPTALLASHRRAVPAA